MRKDKVANAATNYENTDGKTELATRNEKLPQPSETRPHRGRSDKLRKRLRMPQLTKKKAELLQSADFDRVGHSDCTSNHWPRERVGEDSSDEMATEEEEEEEEEQEEEREENGFSSDADDQPFRSLLLFIPLRLGQERFNLEYKEALKVWSSFVHYCIYVHVHTHDTTNNYSVWKD